jgi:hypothetical protein
LTVAASAAGQQRTFHAWGNSHYRLFALGLRLCRSA